MRAASEGSGNGAGTVPIATGVAAPHSIPAEQSVLGAVLLSPVCLRPLIFGEGLKADHFYRDRHRVIFAAMTAMHDADEHVDSLTLAARLEATGELEAAGGRGGIDELTGGVPNLGGFRRYAQIVREHALVRSLLLATYDIQASIVEHRAAPQELVEMAERAISEIAVDDRRDGGLADPLAYSDYIVDWLKGSPAPGLPLPTDLASLSRMLRLQPGDVTILSGWSGQKKSIVAMQFATAVAGGAHRAVIWTNEDSPLRIFSRYAQYGSGVSSIAAAERRLNDADLAKVLNLLPMPFGVEPVFGWSAEQIARDIRRTAPALAIVDHFHAMNGVTRADEVDRSMQALKAAAGQAQCHLIVVCQLNQERVKGVCRPPPVPRDLRGSGQLFNLADNVVFVYFPEEEPKDEDGQGLGRAVQSDRGHVDVAKSKSAGETGAVPVLFDKHGLRLVDAVRPVAEARAETEPF